MYGTVHQSVARAYSFQSFPVEQTHVHPNRRLGAVLVTSVAETEAKKKLSGETTKAAA